MRLHLRTASTAAALVLAGLSLTACGGDADKADKAGGATTSATASASASASASAGASGSADSSTGGPATKSPSKGTSNGGGSTGGDGGATSACTTKNTSVAFIVSAQHANEHEPAAATVKVTNTSKATCTIVGATTLVAKDDQGKAEPISADTSRNGTDAVDIEPGASAVAYVSYADLNMEGTGSAREVCAVQASTVEIALPDDEGRNVKVAKADGSAGTFNVCGPDVKFDGFGK
ncbi:DUF4232 domain-containing protein [Streptomyces sp. P9(2023)]|uniref:DUF4232 domain-containing protein n=1 Tax=Streptomyces sp. P9(2023) TaxID=3064394 RepID=UPI0028F42EC6|nr:DUF4232 domain-containing protein [Streptomyces sp. P9(2023)]MDT9687264.1 DUF4232 domain-containing protein [Streptomyces sp. P9(2023)]